jgi:TfoX/Sxy family transcriptional regulator of competence genes
MAFDEALAERIRECLGRRNNVGEKKMFGGICFFLNGNMLVGVWKKSLIVRVGEDQMENSLLEPHVSEFNITGRAMKHWVMVAPEGAKKPDQLSDWITSALKFVAKLPAKKKEK